MRLTEIRFHLSLGPHKPPLWMGNQDGVLSLLVSTSAENLFLQYSVNLENGHRTIQGKIGGYLLHILWVLSPGEVSLLISVLCQKVAQI